ncbi:MAG: acylphosphatase [Bacteroidales bacterium]|nr:acylphosphatase [Bacteroidales bacterium]
MEYSNIMHLNIEISGMVQGVGFRYATVQAARKYGIKGFVKNLFNGNVYIEAESNKKNLEEFSHWCSNGPSHAHVDEIKITEDKPKNFTVFEVRY